MERQDHESNFGKINFIYKSGDPLVVYLNGFGSFDTYQSFSKIIDFLPKNYGIFAPDYLNSGYSGKSLKKYTIIDEANELAKIINGFDASNVIILAHSIGGVYAMQMKDKIKNLKAFVGIEPTTREIILNPPQEQAYIEKSKDMEKLEELIRINLENTFTQEENKTFWDSTTQNAQKFDQKANQNAQLALENDPYWHDKSKLINVPSVIIAEKYREDEYLRSEYVSNNSKSKVIPLGSFHYIHFEYPKEIANIVKNIGL